MKNGSNAKIVLSPRKWKKAISAAGRRHLPKYRIYRRGGLYSYSTDKKGNQLVTQISFESWWIANLQSFFNNAPSTLNIEVLEDWELLLINQEESPITN